MDEGGTRIYEDNPIDNWKKDELNSDFKAGSNIALTWGNQDVSDSHCASLGVVRNIAKLNIVKWSHLVVEHQQDLYNSVTDEFESVECENYKILCTSRWTHNTEIASIDFTKFS
ncbi:hypothetical protein ACH5RR_023081 [Cinchona calisaya]|uniref:Uncharacterized protein n=1 Tax=Cinchona calisaya TaxID=153742 RepID=A0ABD2Z9M9_9GENT